MRTALSPDNPFGHTRAGYAWEKVPSAGAPHLDFGCNEGVFLDHLARRTQRRLIGVDVSRPAIAAGRTKRPDVELVHLAGSGSLPFPDGYFGSISLLDVIEHIADQKRILDELFRVLAPDGVLIVTVPGRYVFSWLDAGNLKFRFPRLHRWAFCLTHSREDYETRYARNPDGLIGDVEAAKAWHEHFTPAGLGSLLGRSGFEVIEFDGSGFWGRPLRFMTLPLARAKLVDGVLTGVYRLDSRFFSSMNLFCTARKRAEVEE